MKTYLKSLVVLGMLLSTVLATGAGSAPSCPLSLPEQVKSVRAFAEMMPVFRHPRCANCHGGVNPFVEPEIGKHRGGAMEPNTEGCQECHGKLKGWDVPGAQLLFAGKSDEKICMQMKETSLSGDDFVEHIRHDRGHVQFIAAGFSGDRALDKESLAAYDVVIDKPPGTHEQLTQKARNWVKALGGKFVGSPECGCVMPTLELVMSSEWIADGAEAVTAEVKATVELTTADRVGIVFTGRAPLQHGRYTAPTPQGCALLMSPEGGVLDVKEARFDVSEDQRMSISLAVEPTDSGGTMTFDCPSLPRMTLPIMPWSGNWKFVHQPDLIGNHYSFDGFDAASGHAFSGARGLVGRKEVSRSHEQDGLTSRARTTFELWSVELQAK